MQHPLRRHARTLGLATGALVLVVVTASPALAAPAPVTGLAVAGLAPHGVVLTWTASGTADPVVRDVTGLAPADYATGRLVTPTGTADCPVTSCVLDTGFTNTTTQTYAVWAADTDGSTSTAQTLAVSPLAPLATETVLDLPPTSVLAGAPLALTGHVTRAGAPFAGASVLLRSSVLGSTAVTTLRTLTAAADGTVATSLVPTRSRTYWLELPSDSWSSGSTSTTQTVRLLPRVSAVASPATVAWKQSSVLRGGVTPALAGATVAVQRWTGTTWTTVALRTVSSTSTWSLTVAPAVGTYRYRAALRSAASYLGATSSVVTLRVTPRTLYQGLSGPDVLAVERRLAALHYDVGRVDGYFDYDLRHAVSAFQKVERLSRTGVWGLAERTRAPHPRGFVPRYRTAGLSVEVDITRQVLVLSKGGVVLRIVDVSTGSERVYYQEGVRQVAHTPRGSFRIYKKIDGIRISPLGELYRPSYFFQGFAIHGNGSVPLYPASHGCVRITDHVADRLFTTLAIGTRVFVYDE